MTIKDEVIYRLSSYTIPVRIDDTPDKTMLIHGYTGAIDVANQALADYLTAPGTLDPKEAPFSENTWNVLVSRGYITTRSAGEEQDFVARMADAYHRQNKLFNGFTFIPSYNCNFRCPYCVEAAVSGNGCEWSHKTFTREMADRAYAAMEEINPHREFHLKQIVLYGGEPLLAENAEIIRYIVEKGAEKGYRFKAITNGYDLEAFADLLSPEKINILQITVDGSKEWHDRRRVHFRDGGTFDKIVANIGRALGAGVAVAVRINTDRNNIGSIRELKELFTQLGYYEYDKLFSVHAGWLFDNGAGEEAQAGAEGGFDYFSLKELNQELKDSGLKVSCPSDLLFTTLYNAISQKKRLSLSPTGCSSQSGAYIFDPAGEIYSCLETVGHTERSLGNYAAPEGGIRWRQDEVDRWHGINIATTPGCSKCKYALLCKGGCVYKKMQHRNRGVCESFADMFRTAVNKAYHTCAGQ